MILARFINRTDSGFDSLHREMKEFKNEMHEFKNEMKEDAKKGIRNGGIWLIDTEHW
jgi:hypothetical protein